MARRCTIRVISKQSKISLTSKVYYFTRYGPPVVHGKGGKIVGKIAGKIATNPLVKYKIKNRLISDGPSNKSNRAKCKIREP